jgi:hypothetical protein
VHKYHISVLALSAEVVNQVVNSVRDLVDMFLFPGQRLTLAFSRKRDDCIIQQSSGLKLHFLSLTHFHLALKDVVDKGVCFVRVFVKVLGFIKGIVDEGVGKRKTHFDRHLVFVFYVYSHVLDIQTF